MPNATATKETSMPDPKTWGPIIEPGKDFTGTWMPLKESDAAVTTNGKNRRKNLVVHAVLEGVPIYVVVTNQYGSGIYAGLTSLFWNLSKRPVESKKGVPPVYTAKIRMIKVSDEETDSPLKQETRHLEEVKKIVRGWHQFRTVQDENSTRIITLYRKVALTIQDKLFEEHKQQWKETGNKGELISGRTFTEDQMEKIVETICAIEMTTVIK